MQIRLESAKDRAKRAALSEVNEDGGFGRRASDVSFSPSDLEDVLARQGWQ